MKLSQLTQEDFPLIYQQGNPVAVVVDLETFRQLISAIIHLQELTQDEEEAWIMDIVTKARAYRQAHPDEVMTFDSPEAVLAALEAVDE